MSDRTSKRRAADGILEAIKGSKLRSLQALETHKQAEMEPKRLCGLCGLIEIGHLPPDAKSMMESDSYKGRIPTIAQIEAAATFERLILSPQRNVASAEFERLAAKIVRFDTD